MNWKIKAAMFRGLSRVPFGDHLLYQLQRRVTHEMPRRPEVLRDLLVASGKVLELYDRYGSRQRETSSFLEIGAGRDLAVALALRLAGVSRVVCVDIARLAKLNLIQHAADHLAAMTGMKVPVLHSWDDVANFGIEYRAPALLQELPLADRSFDCFYSTGVLEHIREADLGDVLRTGYRLLADGGVAVHAIDYSDHYARSHSGLSRFSFLIYTAAEWARFNPPLHYVNRLRHSQFIRQLEAVDYEVVHNEPTRQPIEVDIIDRLAPEFRSFDHADLFTLRSWIVGSVRHRLSAIPPAPTGPIPSAGRQTSVSSLR